VWVDADDVGVVTAEGDEQQVAGSLDEAASSIPAETEMVKPVMYQHRVEVGVKSAADLALVLRHVGDLDRLAQARREVSTSRDVGQDLPDPPLVRRAC